MNCLCLLPYRFNVEALRRTVDTPIGWNAHRARTAPVDSPHHFIDDIWVRALPPHLVGRVGVDEPYEYEWYAHAATPAVQQLTQQLLAQLPGVLGLGGILITRVPSGRTVRVHDDHGYNAHNFGKYAIQVKGDRWQGFCFKDEEIKPESGQSFWFYNQAPHWVYNCSYQDRITLIISVMTERGTQVP